MGYPMTYKRVVNRNSLAEGGYVAGGVPTRRWTATREKFNADVDYEGVLVDQIDRLYESLAASENRLNLIRGDLRRLEADTVDENVICQVIANRTGVEVDSVAAVLKAWMQE